MNANTVEMSSTSRYGWKHFIEITYYVISWEVGTVIAKAEAFETGTSCMPFAHCVS